METTKVKEVIICDQCKKPIVEHDGIGTGYGRNDKDEKICYACCGENDLQSLYKLEAKKQFILYFSKGQISNWPGSLKITPSYVRTSKHNFGCVRSDFWFNLKDNFGMLHRFHGYQIGDNNEIAHIYKIK